MESYVSVRLPGRSRASFPVLTDFNFYWLQAAAQTTYIPMGFVVTWATDINTDPGQIRTTDSLIVAWPPEATA